MVPFHRPEITIEEEDAVLRVLRSGWLTTGREASAFEKEFAEMVEAGSAIAVSSCTAALHLGLRHLNVGKGDEVLVPTLTFAATAQVVEQCGARPAFVDIDPATGNMSLQAAEAALTKDTVGAIWVHFAGNPTGYEEFVNWAHLNGLFVLEDAAHAFTARSHGTPVGGSSRTLAAFSFYPTKPLTTGEGGMLTFPGTVSASSVAAVREMTLHGVDQDAYQRSRTAVYHYEVGREGYKYNLPDLLAAVGRAQLERAPDAQVKRAIIASLYQKGLPQELEHLHIGPGIVSSHHLFVVRIPPGALRVDRDEFAGRLLEKGVGSSVHYRPLHLHKYWYPKVDRTKLRQAEAFYAYCLSLPIFQGMVPSEVDQVIDAFNQTWKECQL